jgi:hypothetical protein
MNAADQLPAHTTQDRLRTCCAILGWGAGTLAHHADVNLMTARRWLNGQVPVPTDVVHIIE